MKTKHLKYRKAFTVVEIAICILVLSIMATVMSLKPDAVKQTAKREADRVAAYVYSLMEEASLRHVPLNIQVGTTPEGISRFVVTWNNNGLTPDVSFKASPGCKYEANVKEFNYNLVNKRFDAGTITVHGADGKNYYVIFAGINEGRVRTSKEPPPK